MFQHFGFPLDTRTRVTVKQTFSLTMLVECECIKGMAMKLSRMSELLAEKERLRQMLNT